MTTTVNVTAEHIAAGERQSCSKCPIALAVRDAFPDARYVAVGAPEISFADSRGWVEAELPDAAREFIVAFDADAPVEPFSFAVRRPAVTP